MPRARTNAGDPARTLELLWRTAAPGPRHGPAPGLTIDGVVAAAIAVADAEGLDAVTMRRVATELRVAPMTLYTYVPGKAELLDLMLDDVYRRMPRPGRGARDWRTRLTAVADRNRALFTAHPWAVNVSTVRPPLGPGAMAKYEYELSALDGLGLDDVTMDDALTCLLAFVQASARTAADVRAARQDSALTDEQWWAANEPLLRRVFDPEAYPVAARVGAAAGAAHGTAYDPEHAYQFGLRRVLDGLAALIEGNSAGTRAR